MGARRAGRLARARRGAGAPPPGAVLGAGAARPGAHRAAGQPGRAQRRPGHARHRRHPRPGSAATPTTVLENIELFREYCAELGVLDRPWPFASDHARFSYFRTPGRDPRYAAFDDTRPP